MRQRWKVASTGLGTEEGSRNGSSLSFPAHPWESAESEVKDPLGLLWSPDRRESRVEGRKEVVWYRAGQRLSPV